MKKLSPQIEIYSDERFNPRPGLIQQPHVRSRRLIIFGMVFLLSAAISLAYNYTRPAIYRSSATLLTSAMTAIDSDSTKAADAQHVAIQKQLLLGQELLAKTASQLKASTAVGTASKLTDSEIQKLLSVEPIPETNLVEIRAEGTDSAILPVLVNTWTEVYQDARAEDIKNLTDSTTKLIVDELKGLAEKTDAKRVELEYFRRINDISSSGRDENEPLARLNGLNNSLNKAMEEEVNAKAALDAVKSAIDRGQAVVPDREQGNFQNLETRLQELHEKLAEFDKRFTRDYMSKKFKYNPIPDQIAKLEQELRNKQDYGRRIVLTEAENKYAAAQQTVIAIRDQLAAQQNQAAAFTTKFAKFETLKTDLESLDKLYRDTQERLVKIETNQKEKYPQVSVISKAYASATPIKPDYSRDALISLVGSLLLGLFAVWIFEYLTRKQEQPSAITMSGIHVYNSAAADRLTYRHPDYQFPDYQHLAKPLEQKLSNALASSMFRELSSHQLRVLLNAASPKGKQLIGLLLSGLTLAEISTLSVAQVDWEAATLDIAGAMPRTLPIGNSFKTLLLHPSHDLDWFTNKPPDDLAVILMCAAIDSGLPNPGEITVAAIRHSYITYLVRQGLRLSELEQITGHLDASVISSYSAYSPPQQGRSIDEIELLHPALVDIA
jgi:polysaccharide biosynthesis transport protein